MTREEIKTKTYEHYAEQSKTPEYVGVMIFYVTKEGGIERLIVSTKLTEEEFYQKLSDLELQENFKGYVGEDAVKVTCTYHSSDKKTVDADRVGPNFYPPPIIDRVLVNHRGQMFVSNGKSSTQVNYCPFTGEKALVQMTKIVVEEDNEKRYRYE